MVTGEATQIRPPAATNLAPEIELPSCHRRRLNNRSKARTTVGSCATPNRIPKITARGHLSGFTGDDRATSAEIGRNPGEVYSKRMQWSHCLSVTARKQTPQQGGRPNLHLKHIQVDIAVPHNHGSSITARSATETRRYTPFSRGINTTNAVAEEGAAKEPSQTT